MFIFITQMMSLNTEYIKTVFSSVYRYTGLQFIGEIQSKLNFDIFLKIIFYTIFLCNGTYIFFLNF